MAPKPENVFRGKVHKLLPRKIYQMKTSSPYLGGVWDDYYESPAGMLWVEYKFIEKLPRGVLLPDMSPLQLNWGDRLLANGRPCAVCVGVGRGRGAQGVWFTDGAWITGTPVPELELLTIQQIADMIEESIGR
jgi:hypothetical protein